MSVRLEINLWRHPDRSRFGRPPALSRGRAKRGGGRACPETNVEGDLARITPVRGWHP